MAVRLDCKTFEHGIPDFAWATGPVQMARTRIAEIAMDGRCWKEHDHARDAKACVREPYDFVLMHDDDLVVTPQAIHGSNGIRCNPLDVWHDLFDANPKLGAIGACYMLERPMKPNVVVPHPRYPEELCHVVCGLPPAPIEVGGVATGFMMIRVSVLRELDAAEEDDGGPPMFRFPMRQTRWGTIETTGEDYDFCRRVRAIGYQVVADPRWQTTHLKERGQLVYDQEQWEKAWSGGVIPAHLAAEYKEQLHPDFAWANIGGMLCLDHTPIREKDAKAWRQRQRKAA
jgi:hypothetical protein